MVSEKECSENSSRLFLIYIFPNVELLVKYSKQKYLVSRKEKQGSNHEYVQLNYQI